MNKINQYTCLQCSRVITTVEHVEGVTPTLVDCQRIGCRGQMLSSWYKLSYFEFEPEPTHEWYKPINTEGFSRSMRQYIKQGGLVLREIGAAVG